MDIFFFLFYQPAYNLILTTYSLIPSGLGLILGIFVIGVIVRMIMFPMVRNQVKMMKQNSELQEKIKRIQEKYKNDKEKLNLEMMKLNSEIMPAMISGCLPLLLQLIIFINIDRVIRDLFDPSKGISAFQKYMYNPNLLNGNTQITSNLGFFDFDVGAIPSQVLQQSGILNFLPYLVVILMTALVQYLSLKLSFYYSRKKRESIKIEKSKNTVYGDNDELTNTLAKTSEQITYLFPMLLIIGSLAFPIGLTVYWLVQSLLGMAQQYYFMKIVNTNNLSNK